MTLPDARPRVLLAYSGGLDTSYLVAWLTREAGYEVTALTVDCGGLDEREREELAARARAFGAVEHRIVDARRTLFERVLRWLVAGNARRGGTYPISVAAERGLQAEVLAGMAREEGYDAVAHGCTGAGNDQIRFEAALSVVAEGLTVLAPVRDLAPSREEECGWLESQGLEPPVSGACYSVNAGLWGLTIGGGALHHSGGSLPEEAWQWTRNGGGEATIELAFEDGVPVALDGVAMDPVALIERLNVLAGRYGVGRGYHLGDTILGHKGRIGYEAPAAEVLLTAHRELEKLVLTEEQRFWKDQLGEVYGKRLHQGLLHDPVMRDLEAFFGSSQGRVTGTVRVVLAGRAALVEAVESPFSLMAASDARYGERPAAGSDPGAGAALARVLSEPARLARRAAEAAASHGAPAELVPAARPLSDGASLAKVAS